MDAGGDNPNGPGDSGPTDTDCQDVAWRGRRTARSLIFPKIVGLRRRVRPLDRRHRRHVATHETHHSGDLQLGRRLVARRRPDRIRGQGEHRRPATGLVRVVVDVGPGRPVGRPQPHAGIGSGPDAPAYWLSRVVAGWTAVVSRGGAETLRDPRHGPMDIYVVRADGPGQRLARGRWTSPTRRGHPMGSNSRSSGRSMNRNGGMADPARIGPGSRMPTARTSSARHHGGRRRSRHVVPGRDTTRSAYVIRRRTAKRGPPQVLLHRRRQQPDGALPDIGVRHVAAGGRAAAPGSIVPGDLRRRPDTSGLPSSRTPARSRGPRASSGRHLDSMCRVTNHRTSLVARDPAG